MAYATASDSGIRYSGGDIGILLLIGGALLALWLIHPRASFAIGR